MALSDSHPRLLVMVGPTGVGKSALALKIAESWHGEIINADSMQVYRYMDIGTAKPGTVERERAPHHLIDIIDPDEDFNAALYTVMARKVIDRIDRKIPLLVIGGTGLYIKTLLGGLAPVPGADEGLRNYLKNQLQQFGKAYLYEMLKKKDHLAAHSIDPANSGRVIRALEVWEQTGKSIVEQQLSHRFTDRRYTSLKIGLMMEREELYKRIERRTDEMIARGFVDEVKWLLEQGYDATLKSMQSIGYRHLSGYLRGSLNLKDAVSAIKRDTRHYAKRQMTWFAADKEVRWLNIDDEPAIMGHVKSFFQSLT